RRSAPRRRAVHRVLHRPRHVHAQPRPDAGPAHPRRARGALGARDGRALRVDRRAVAAPLPGQPSPDRGALGRGARPGVGPVPHRRDAQLCRGPDGRGAVRAPARGRAAGMLSGFSGVLVVALTSAVVLVLLQAGAFGVGRRLGRVNVVDVTWGLGFAVIALVAVILPLAGGRSPGWHAVVVAALVAVW